MSISLPNGTLLAAPASQVQYTAAVTRILHLTNFSKELKTRDLQVMFKDYEGEKGGFRIKWVDDINALVVFADAGIAKRAYLSFLLRPPPSFASPAQIKPYDKPDAGQIIAALSARAMGHRASMSSAVTGSGAFGHANGSGYADQAVSGGATNPHGRASSISGANGGMGSFSFPKSRASMSGSNPFSAQSSTIGGNSNGNGNGIGSGNGVIGGARHIRTGSASAGGSSGAFNRQSNSGVLGFGGSASANIPFASRLATHSESLDSPGIPTAPYPARRTTRQNQADLERVTSLSGSSSDNEPVVVMDHAPTPGGNSYIASGGHGSWSNGGNGANGGGGNGGNGGFGQWKMPGTGGSSGMAARRDSVSAEKALREVEKALASVEAQ